MALHMSVPPIANHDSVRHQCILQHAMWHSEHAPRSAAHLKMCAAHSYRVSRGGQDTLAPITLNSYRFHAASARKYSLSTDWKF
eukprot:1019660-Amphidinium_carterae.1